MNLYKIQLRNKIRKGRAVGNEWHVIRYLAGCHGVSISMHDDREVAELECAKHQSEGRA